MRLLSLWAAERKRLKKSGRKEKETPKKKEKMMEEKKRKREEMMRLKHEEEISKVENFIDENIHEAFDTLAIYQKCLEDERRKKTISGIHHSRRIRNISDLLALNLHLLLLPIHSVAFATLILYNILYNIYYIIDYIIYIIK